MGSESPQERLGIGCSRDVDVAALGVGDHEQPVLARPRRDLLQRSPPRRPESLEAGDLELDRDALLGDGLNRQRAMERNSLSRPHIRRRGQAVGRTLEFDRAWPQSGRIGIQPEHQLGPAVGYPACQPIAKRAVCRGAGRTAAVTRVGPSFSATSPTSSDPRPP